MGPAFFQYRVPWESTETLYTYSRPSTSWYPTQWSLWSVPGWCAPTLNESAGCPRAPGLWTLLGSSVEPPRTQCGIPTSVVSQWKFLPPAVTVVPEGYGIPAHRHGCAVSDAGAGGAVTADPITAVMLAASAMDAYRIGAVRAPRTSDGQWFFGPVFMVELFSRDLSVPCRGNMFHHILGNEAQYMDAFRIYS